MNTNREVNRTTHNGLKRICTDLNQFANTLHVSDEDRADEVESHVREFTDRLNQLALAHRVNTDNVPKVGDELPEPPVEGDDA